MQNLTYDQVPGFIGTILAAVAICFALSFAYDYRRQLRRFFRAALARYIQVRPRSSNEQVQREEPQQNAPEPGSFGSFGEPNGRIVLHLSADDVEAINRMIAHKISAQKPTQASTIQAGFGVSKGESAKYVRAKAIYDMLFGNPANLRYTPLDEEKKPAELASAATPAK